MTIQRTALITGAASGIGLAIARRLAANGMHVMLADRSEQVHEVTRSLCSNGGRAIAHLSDLGQPEQVLDLANAAKTALGHVDILVNNAGVHPKNEGRPFKLPEITTPDWETVLRINLTAPFVLCRELVPTMQVGRWGRIINIASRAGRTFIEPVGVHCSASKAGLIGLTRQIAGAYAADRITANCIAPGRVETPLSSTSSDTIIQKAIAGVPAGRLGTPNEIAAVAEFLASDGAAFVTGVCIDANGGAFIG